MDERARRVLIVEPLIPHVILADMSMSQTQITEQVAYLQNRIERQREIIDALETEGYGGEVIRRSRMLLKQIIADLDGLLLKLRAAGAQANPAKATRQPTT